MEYYTIGQVIEKLGIDEVAIKVDGEFGECEVRNYSNLPTGIYFDKNDNNILKSLDNSELFISKAEREIKRDLFVIMPREAYERILND